MPENIVHLMFDDFLNGYTISGAFGVKYVFNGVASDRSNKTITTGTITASTESPPNFGPTSSPTPNIEGLATTLASVAIAM